MHILLIPTNVEIPKFLLYHELTHIYDMEMLGVSKPEYNHYLTGYMEYHASQVELLVMMGATTINDRISFSVSDSLNGIDESVLQYLETKLDMAKRMIQDPELKKRVDGLGALFNFFGLKSICYMFATDFVDNYGYREFADQIPTMVFVNIRNLFSGWIDDIDSAVALYAHVERAIIDYYTKNR